MGSSERQRLFDMEVCRGMSLPGFILISLFVTALILIAGIVNLGIVVYILWSAFRIADLTRRVIELEEKMKNPADVPAMRSNAGEKLHTNLLALFSQFGELLPKLGELLKERDTYVSKAMEAPVGEVALRPIQDVDAVAVSTEKVANSVVEDAVPCSRLENASGFGPAVENTDSFPEVLPAIRATKVDVHKTGDAGDSLPHRSPKSEVTTGTVLPIRKSVPTTAATKFETELPAEVRMVREMLKRLSPNNLDLTLDNLTALVNSSSKHLPEYAFFFVEKAVLDAANSTLMLAHAKLISQIIDNPQGYLRMTMLAIEVSNTLMASLAVLLKLPRNGTSPDFVQHLVEKRDVMEADRQKRNTGLLRFTAELFCLDVLELEDLRTGLMEPLMAKSTDESVEYVCKLLTWVGHRIRSKASRDCGTDQWFANLLSTLESKSKDPDLQASTIVQLKNLIKLKNNGWDPYATAFEEQDQASGVCDVEYPKPKKKKKKNRKTADSSISEEQSSTQTTMTPGSFLTYEAVKASETTISYSSNSSISSYPLSHSSGKLPPEINASEVFSKFLDLDHSSRENSIEWLRAELEHCEEKQLRDFIRSLTRLTTKIWDLRRLNLMGMMIDLLMTTNVVTEDLVIRAIMSGIISDLPIYQRENAPDFISVVKNISIVLVKCWENRMQDLSWLTKLGKNLHTVFPSTWEVFSVQVLDLVLFWKKKEKTRELFNNTGESKDLLLPAAFKLEILKKPDDGC